MKTSMNKLIVLIVIDVVFIVGVILFVGYRNSTNTVKGTKKDTEINNKVKAKEKTNKEVKNNTLPPDYDKEKYDISEIIKSELQTGYYRVEKDKNKFYIDSEEELNKFYSLFDDKLNIDKYYLYNNIVFVQYESVGSSAIEWKLNDVNFENGVINFVGEETVPEGMMTQDMSGWYLVAIIPKSKLNDIEYKSDWVKPSTITKDKYGNYS